MEESRRRWLQVNRKTLLEANVPAMRIVDLLISRGQVYDPMHDDYQKIAAESTEQGQLRALLDTLSAKSDSAVELFRQVLDELCPEALASCISPPHALKELDDTARSHYRENLKVRPLTWLKGSKPVNARTYFLNLSMVEKSVAENVMTNLFSSSAKDLEREEYLYSRPADQTLVRLDRLFPQFQAEQTCEQATMAEGGSRCEIVTSVSAEPANDTVARPDDIGEDAQASVLRSAWHVGIYGGAGCGKTSCLMKAASMYAEGGLWQGACMLIYCKLRDPKVQNADSLKQLLQELQLNLTDDKCKQFADFIKATSGERVIFALDGVDELDTRKNGYVQSILDGSALPKACVLATSRSCSSAKAYFDKYECNLELLGFTEDQVDEFIQQQLGDKPELVAELHRVLVENPTLTSLMLVPLLAMMVCQVFQLTAEKPPTTRTALYSKLLCLILKRTVEKGEGRIGLSDAETSRALEASEVLKLKGTPKALVSELAQLAFLAHHQRKAVFDHDLVDEASCSDEVLKLGLLCGYNAEEGPNIVRQYSFQHLTVQEFLVAYHLITHTISEQAVTDMVSELVSSKDNHVVLQFFAGLLADSLRPHFFACLNQWLWDGYMSGNEDCRSRLRVCLQCAKESCGENVKDFPSALQLPESVYLDHVTAADLTQLSLAVEKSQHIKELVLRLDEGKVESEKRKVSRVKTQTRRGMTRLMAAINRNKLLRKLQLYGPKYSLFEEEGWRLLVKAVENNSLVSLLMVYCTLDNTSFHFLSNVLKHNTQLKFLRLDDNCLNDVSVCTLADALKHNKTLYALDLTENSYREDSREHLQRELDHIRTLFV